MSSNGQAHKRCRDQQDAESSQASDGPPCQQGNGCSGSGTGFGQKRVHKVVSIPKQCFDTQDMEHLSYSRLSPPLQIRKLQPDPEPHWLQHRQG